MITDLKAVLKTAQAILLCFSCKPAFIFLEAIFHIFLIFKIPTILPSSYSQVMNSLHISLRKEKLSDMNSLIFPPLIYTFTLLSSFPPLWSVVFAPPSKATSPLVFKWTLPTHSIISRQCLPLYWIIPIGTHMHQYLSAVYSVIYICTSK